MIQLLTGDPRYVGEYRIVARVGAGGMGVVYRAVDPAGQPVAVKVIRDEYAGDLAFRHRFAREVEACRRVAGACTVRVLDADPGAPRPYLVTEYVAGMSLAEYVVAQGPLPSSALRALAIGLAEAVNAVHAAGIVHRDLKPSNVLLAESGPKVIDFGIATATEATAPLARTGMVIGSPGWMAPEQVTGDSHDPAGDVYCWALLVAFAATGRPPFGEGQPDAVLYRIVHGRPNLDGVDSSLLPVLQAALATDPRCRPSASEVLHLLLGEAAADVATAVTGVMEREWVDSVEIASELRPAHSDHAIR